MAVTLCKSTLWLRTSARRCLTAPLSRRPRTAAFMASAAGPPAGYHLLRYSYVPDILERRAPHRQEHLALANEKLEAGKILMAGAGGDPVNCGLFVFANSTKQDVEGFANSDPYVKNGLVTQWEVIPWTVVIGPKI